MKKSLLILFGAILIIQGSSIANGAESNGIFSTLKNAIIKDVQDTVNSTITTTANSALDKVKLSQYKQELQQKKNELADLEASKTNAFVKFFKKRRLNKDIEELENQIKALEK